jgi:hypothetical protein
MPSLSLIETEARHLLGRIPETRRRAFQDALVALCETHWHELSGQQRESPLAEQLLPITPPLADLFIDLYAAGDAGLDDVLQGQSPAQGLALLVMAEIERGNEEGAQIAHDPMMAFQVAPSTSEQLERVAGLLRGTLEIPPMHRHDSHPPLFKALAVIAAHIKRVDLPGVLCAIRLIITSVGVPEPVRDSALEKLRTDVLETGIRFLSVDDDHILLEQHGHEHKPVRARQLGEMLREIRQVWLT